MPGTVTSLFFSLALLMAPASAEPPVDVIGWEEIPWGSGQADIARHLDRFPSYAEARTEFAHTACSEFLVEEPYTYLEHAFDGLALCLSKDRLKSAYLLKVAGDESAQNNLFRSLEMALVERYGPPSHSPEQKTLVWQFPSTTFHLRNFEGFVTINFAPTTQPRESAPTVTSE